MKTVEELAREAGGRTTSIPGDLHSDGGWFFEYEPDRACPSLERFAALVRQQVLVEVLAVCDKAEQDLRGVGGWDNEMMGVPAGGVRSIIERLRAAGSKP